MSTRQQNDALPPSPRRTTRKEFLLTREEQARYRVLRLIMLGVGAFLALVLLIGLVFEYSIKPNQPVATVNGENIPLRDWQQRVRLERSQTIAAIDNLFEMLGGNGEQLLQFAGQQMEALAFAPQVIGQNVLLEMIDEVVVRQEAAELGITVTEAEVQTAIEEQFNYYGGGLPPAAESGPATPVPTPSVTPIRVSGLESEVAPEAAEPTAVPTPFPTATPVSQEAFNERFNEVLEGFIQSGGSEADYRALIRHNLLRTKLAERISADIVTEAENFNVLYISFATEVEANEALAAISAGEADFLTAWNAVRSNERTDISQPFATEMEWSTQATMNEVLGADAAELVTGLTVGQVRATAGSNDRWLLLSLTGREMRPLPETELENARNQALQTWLVDKRGDAVTYESRWLSNVPNRPVLNVNKYLSATAPQVVEPQPIIITVEPVSPEQ